MEAVTTRTRTAKVSGSRFTPALERFSHRGPGGDARLEREEPDLYRALAELFDTRMFAGVPVTRQDNGDWCVLGDRNLASPWVAVQSIQSVLGIDGR